MKLPEHIKQKLRRMAKHALAARMLEDEISDWFASKGIDLATEDDRHIGFGINDTIIDMTTVSFDPEATIAFIEAEASGAV